MTPARAAVVFANTDIGFSEGAATAGLVGRLDRMEAFAGKGLLLRLDLNWWAVQGCRTCTPDFSTLDTEVNAAHARGMRVLLILDYAPPWANGGHTDDKWFPLTDSDWQTIVDATVSHFHGRVSAYEVWNEPNFTAFGNFGDNSVAARRQRYWELVRIAYLRVHAGCQTCVVLAGASGAGDPTGANRNDNEPAAWLDWAYENLFGDYFDAVTHHPYPAWSAGHGPTRPECTTRWWNMFGPADPKCGELAAVREIMIRHGDRDKKIWGTEFGYPSTAASPSTVRDHLVEGVRLWRALDYTGPLFLHSFTDTPRCAADATDPECHYGLTTSGGVPKQPAYDSLQQIISGQDPSAVRPQPAN